MPALPAAPKTLRVALSGLFTGGGVWLTRFYLQYTGTAPTNAQLGTFDASVVTAYTAQIQALQDNQTELLQVNTIDLSSATSAVDTTAAAVIGSRGSPDLPGQIAMVISYEIGRRYRGGHPRGYWPMGVSGDMLDTRRWSPTFLTTVTTNTNAFFTALFAAGWTGAGTITHVNVSYFSGFTVVTNPITHRARNVPTLRVAPTIDTVTSIVPRAYYGTQRRREAFIG